MDDTKVNHSIPAVAVQLDIGYGIQGIEYFCNRPDHRECREELQKALRTGGSIAVGTYWHDRQKRN